MNSSALAKAELHAHLNGCIPPTLVAQLLPRGHRLQDTTILTPVQTMSDYFKPWATFRSLCVSKAATTSVLIAVAEAQEADHVVYAELRNSVRHLANLNDISWTEAIEWLLAGMDEASAHTDLRLIVTLTREHFEVEAANRMLDAISILVDHPRLVGIDLAGDEDIPIDSNAYRVFRRARESLGLGVTIHAGETGSEANIRWAVECCGADRLGHALAAVNAEDTLQLLVDRGICVEVCLSSNLLSGRLRTLEEHPVIRFVEHGVPFVLCSDNPAMHQRSLSFEYELFRTLCPRASLDGMLTLQERHSFRSGQ